MVNSDKQAFLSMLVGVGQYYDKAISKEVVGIYWNALEKYDYQDVNRAVTVHMADPEHGSFMPKIADIVRQIDKIRPDGRISADEAWGVVCNLGEEHTIVWTEEMKGAYFAALPILEVRDAVGARMAFRQAYERLCAESRISGKQPKWEVSLGQDAAQREHVIIEAVRLGRIPAERAPVYLPPERSTFAGLIDGAVRTVKQLEHTNQRVALSAKEAISELSKLKSILNRDEIRGGYDMDCALSDIERREKEKNDRSSSESESLGSAGNG